MADIFTFVKGNKKKVYNIAGGTEEEAIKYVRYLHRNALFGTHTGLPQKIRNSKMNESLVSNIGDYSVLDVYAYPQTKCIIGTVVNFHISNDVNPLGETYVYPCTDKNKPMGYMISDATPDTMGVCLVHGVLEVPLYYFSGSIEEKKDFVEYDIENACFKFADSGYPVFNVYQDVDGDWIAIILFGDVSSDYEYDGPFAVSVAGITGSTTFVDVLGGDVFFNDVRDVCDDLTVPIGISTGESLWLSTAIVGNTHSYDFIAQSTAPIDGSTVFYTKIAENNDGDIRQIHYGDIRYSRTKIIAGSNKITVSPSNGLGDVTIDINESVIGGGTFYTPNYTQLAISGNTVPEGYLGQTFVLPVRAGTVGFFDDGGDARAVWTDKDGSTSIQLTSGNLYSATKDGWLRVSVIDGGTSSGACLSIQDSTGNLPIYKYGSFGEKNIEYLEGIGISITGQTDSTTGVYTGKKIINMNTAFSVSVTSPTATISLTGSTNSLTITAGSGVSISANGSNGIIISATGGTVTPYVQDLTHVFSTGTAILGLTDSNVKVSFNTAGNTYINEGSSGEIIIGSTSGNLMCSSTDSTDKYAIYISDTPTSMVYLKAGDGITLGFESGNTIVLGSTFTETPQDLSASVDNNGVATLSLSSSSNTVKLIQGTNVTITAGQNANEVVINSTVTGNTGTVTGITSSIGTNSATVSTIGGSGSAVFVGAGNSTVYSGDDGVIVIGSTFTETPQNLSASVSGNTAFVNLSGSTSNVKLIKGNNITLEAGEGSDEIIIGSTFSEFEYDGAFAAKVSSVDSTTLAVSFTMNAGAITYEKTRKDVSAINTATSIASGQSYWLEYNTVTDSVSRYKSASPHAASSNVIQVKLIENVGGVLKQVQFGEIVLSKPNLTWEYNTNTHVVSLGVTGSTKSITMYGKNGIVLSNDNTSNTIAIYLSGTIGTVTGITSSITGNTATISAVGGSGTVVLTGGTNTRIEEGEDDEIVISTPTPDLSVSSDTLGTASLNISGSTSYVNLVQGTGVSIALNSTNEVVISSTVTGNTGTVTGITSSISGNTATVSSIGGTGNVVFYGVGGTTISSGANGEIVIGSTVSGGTGSSFDYTGSFKVDCWDTYDEDDGTIHHYSITDSNNRDDDYGFAGWVHIGNQKYGVLSRYDDFVDGDVVYLVGTFDSNNNLSNLEFRTVQTFFPTINDNQFCVRICYATNGKMYQTQYGDIVQPARYVGDGETVEIHNNTISAIVSGGTGITQSIYSAIRGGTPAICITGSTTYVPIAGGTNTYTERDSSGAIIIGSTASGGGGSSVESYLTGLGDSVISGTTYTYYQLDKDTVYSVLTQQWEGQDSRYSVDDLKAMFPSIADRIDDGGDLILVLPSNQTTACHIDLYFFTYIQATFIAPDGKRIVPRGGGSHGYDNGYSSYPRGNNNSHCKIVYCPAGVNPDESSIFTGDYWYLYEF